MSNYDAILVELEEQLGKEREALEAYQGRVRAQQVVVAKTLNAIDVIRERADAKRGEPSRAQKILGAAAQVAAAGLVAAAAYEATKPYRSMTILEAAKTYLAEHGPATAPEVQRALAAGGIRADANTNTVRAILDRARLRGEGIRKNGFVWSLDDPMLIARA